jgi:hypothetical protein
MAIAVKKITLWRREVEDRAGMLAQTLEPLAKAGANLQVVMGYHIGGKVAIEVFPVAGQKAAAAARQAGLGESGPPALLVNGNNRPRLAHAMAQAIAAAWIAELVDALVSGASGFTAVGVRVPPFAPTSIHSSFR